MNASTPPPLPPLPGKAATRSIPVRKILLALMLAGSILFVCLVLLAGGVAILREAAPHGGAGLSRLLLTVARTLVHHIPHHR